MTTDKYLTALRSLGIELSCADGRLRLSAPKGVLTAALRSEISERKTEIIAHLESKGGRITAAFPPIARVSRGPESPLSFAQQRLWFLDQFEPGNPIYNEAGAFRIEGPLVLASAQEAVNRIVDRHEILRTTFAATEGRAVQRVAESMELPLRLVDLTAIPENSRQAELEKCIRHEVRQPFDLRRGPLVRVSVLRLSDEDHVVVPVMHHIVADGWSLAAFLREVAAFYHAIRANQPLPLPELPLQYADFTVWQRTWLQGQFLDRELDYWKKRLDPPVPPLELAIEGRRPAVMSFQGEQTSFALPRELAESLRALSTSESASLFMTLLAALEVLLYRYTGQVDFAIGSPIAGRDRTELEPLIGFFVNTLVLRADLAENPTFRQLLAHVRETCLEAYSHQSVPFEKLVEEVQPPRDLSHTPLFQVMFALQNAPMPELQLPQWRITPLEAHTGTAKFDLTLAITEARGQVRGTLEYSTDLFSHAVAARMVGHYRTLLEAIVADPDEQIVNLAMLTAAEASQLLEMGNGTRRDYPRDQGVHEQFAAQAARTPEATALVSEAGHMTYRQLDERAEELARHLVAAGVGEDHLVGISLPRSQDMIVAVLGALKAGAAYVPIDPDYPEQRLAQMLNESRVWGLLTGSNALERIAACQTKTILVDAPRNDGQASQPGTDLPRSRSDRKIYAIFTSGSTGQPKLAAVRHGGFSNLLDWYVDEFGLSGDDRVLVMTSFSFDLTQKDIFAPLVAGGRLYLLPAGQYDPSLVRRYVRDHRITLINCTPSAFYPLVEHADDEMLSALASLRFVILGGEPIAAERLARWLRSRWCRAELVNSYGPTECTDVCGYFRLGQPEQFCRDGRPVPLGGPVPNTRFYVVDQAMALVPIGVQGELAIAGDCVGVGYLNDPELTRRRFVRDPFSADPDTRMYLTGDLVRRLPDGNLEYVGRRDHQIKIRGFRIELGEIESVMAQDPAVSIAAVIASGDGPSQARLTAYVVPDWNRAASEPWAATAEAEYAGLQSPPDENSRSRPLQDETERQFVERLRARLEQKLPQYMVPAEFVLLNSMPLTPNGKADRRSLARLGQQSTPAPAADGHPRTPLEATLARIWQQVLKAPRVGIDDNFFQSGGHSLAAAELVSRAQMELKLEIPVRVLFQAPTIARLAEAIDAAQAAGGRWPMPQLRLEDEVFLDPAIRGDGSRATPTRRAERVLLTGATGFLGAFLLGELLRQTTADVVCLVRAPDTEQAARRIIEQMERYRIADRLDFRRVWMIPGDLGRPRLGLGEAIFQDLSRTIDVIYHNGAMVNFTSPYPALKPVNVEGTQEVLRLAARAKAKHVHYVSTVSVFPLLTSSDTEVFSEESELADTSRLLDGYSHSKWVAERIVGLARNRGIHATVYRPGRITGDSVTGVGNQDDFLQSLLGSCILLGKAPIGDYAIDMVPVDYVAKAIVHLSCDLTASGKNFNLVNPHPVAWSQLVSWMRSAGYALDEVPYHQWRASLVAEAARSKDPALLRVATLFALGMDEERSHQGHFRPPRFGYRNTEACLRQTGIQCMPVDGQLLEVYFSYFIEHGLPEPTGGLRRSSAPTVASTASRAVSTKK